MRKNWQNNIFSSNSGSETLYKSFAWKHIQNRNYRWLLVHMSFRVFLLTSSNSSTLGGSQKHHHAFVTIFKMNLYKIKIWISKRIFNKFWFHFWNEILRLLPLCFVKLSTIRDNAKRTKLGKRTGKIGLLFEVHLLCLRKLISNKFAFKQDSLG